MDKTKDKTKWSKYADKYDPIKIGSIDGESFTEETKTEEKKEFYLNS